MSADWMLHGVPAYCDTALWVSESRVEAAREEGNALWLHGFMCGLGVWLIVAVAMAIVRKRRALDAFGVEDKPHVG